MEGKKDSHQITNGVSIYTSICLICFSLICGVFIGFSFPNKLFIIIGTIMVFLAFFTFFAFFYDQIIDKKNRKEK